MSRLGQIGHRLYTGETSFDFVGRRRWWYAASAAILVIAAVALVFRGLTFGIEFRGGAEFRVPNAQCSVEQAREAVAGVYGGEPIIQALGSGELRAQTSALQGAQSDQVTDALAQACGVPAGEISVQLIGPSWGGEVTNRALTGLAVFLALVSLVIAVAFEFKMAVAAFVALLHDIVITVGVYALVGFEVTPATVIGFLTILGYSLYDTVVVFDSVRENTASLKAGSRMTYSEAANLSINQTLVRSINTSLIALLPVAAILFVGVFVLGAGTLKDIALALFVGIAASTYSSIFIATPLLADLKEREPDMQALARRVAARRGGEARVAAAADRSSRTGAGRGQTATAVQDRGDGLAVPDGAGLDELTDEGPELADVRPMTGSPANGKAAQARTPGPAGGRAQPKRRQTGRPSGKKRRR